MVKIVIAGSLFSFSFFMAFFRILSRDKNHLNSRLRKYTVNRVQEKREEEDVLSKPFSQRVIRPVLVWFSGFVARFTPARNREKLQNALRQAGSPGSLKAHEFQTLLYLAIILTSAAAWIISWLGGKEIANRILLTALSGAAASLLGRMYLQNRIKKRKSELLRQLPDALDLLTVSVEAGLGFDAALQQVVEKFKGTLAEEFRVTLQELQMGKSRREALRDLGQRTAVEDLHVFVGAMIQADQLGVPITRILRTQAEQVRTKRRQRVEEKAMKAPVKMLIPLVFCIFPSIFIVLLGPAVIKVYEVLLPRF